MKFTARKTTLALSLISAMAAVPSLALELNANIEFDTNYVSTKEGNTAYSGAPARGATQNGRVELNALAKGINGDGFVAAKASFLATRSSDVADDDLWVQFGTKAVDLKLGRFEATDLFPLGRDTIVPFAGFDAYRGHLLRGRTGSDTLQAALTVNPTDVVSLELGVVERNADASRTSVTKGLRPIVSLNLGNIVVRAGAEVLKYESYDAGSNSRSSVDQTGVSLTGTYLFSDGSLNLNASQGKTAADEKTTTVGVTGLYGALGGGLIAGKQGDGKVTTAYITYALPLMDVKGATITPALAYSTGSGSNDAEDVTALRVRINYAF